MSTKLVSWLYHKLDLFFVWKYLAQVTLYGDPLMKRNSLIIVLVLLLPVLLVAQEFKQSAGQISIWDLLLVPKYIVGFVLAILQILLLLNKRINISVRIVFLFLAFVFFGIYFPMHPSPICAVTKPFIYGFKIPFVAAFSFIGLLSIVGSKGFCGTICPAGALQELFYSLPFFKNLKKKKVSFLISNSVRISVAIIFFVFVFSTGITIFAYFSLFELFHWSFDLPLIYLVIFILSLVIILSTSLFMYRPFCYFVCPVGLISWLLEQVSPLKIRYDKDKCTSCGICETEAPCPSVSEILKEKKIVADCHLCGVCINSCPENAIKFGLKK